MNPLFRIDFSISDSLKIVRKSVLIYDTIILSGCRLWTVMLISGVISSLVELSQLYFKLGLFEFDDIFNNILGAVLGWCMFCILRSIGKKYIHY